jgi:hypothetical protein
MERVSFTTVSIRGQYLTVALIHSRFLKSLKDRCLNGKPKNKEFWELIKTEGKELGLISNDEAKKYGGTSDVTKDEANNVSFTPH